MKITITGSLGNTGRPLAEKLTKAGHNVTVITSSDDKSAAIQSLGATAAIGTLDDVPFLISAFRGADAAYTMVPPNFGVADYRQYYTDQGQIFAEAIRQSGVKKIVNLSSVGADLDSGTGPIAGLHDVENSLNELEGVDVKHLRAGFFYTNFLNNIPQVRNTNAMGSNYGPATEVVLVHPVDIADAIARAFQTGFSGKSVEYVSSDKSTFGGVASALGTAIGKPDLKWLEFSDDEVLAALERSGMPVPIAKSFVEMGTAVRRGVIFDDYKKVNPGFRGNVKLSDFATEFAGKY